MTTSSIGSFGDVSIDLVEYPASILFTPLVRGLAVTTVLSSDYHDYSGLHSGSLSTRIRETIISSHKDTLLDNTTSNSV